MVTIWVDYGSEGWVPTDFERPDEAVRYIQSGIYGAFRITKEVEIRINVIDKEEQNGN